MEKCKQIFMIKGFLLIVIFILILLILNHFYVENIEFKKQVYRKEAEWQEYKKNILDSTLNYAFIGDSHTRDGLNPKYLNDSFNFATSAEDYIESYYKIKKLIEKDKIKINNLVLELDLHTFSNKLRTDENLFREARYYNLLVPQEEMMALKGKNKVSLLLDIYLPVIGKGGDLITYFIAEPNLTPLELGWVNNKGNFLLRDREKMASEKYKAHFNKTPSLMNEKSLLYFQKILEMAKEKDINIIFIKYPVSEEYNKEVEKHNISRSDYYTSLFERVEEVTNNYIILDYYDLFFGYPEYFYNPDHLNHIGSTILSKKVWEGVQNSINYFPSERLCRLEDTRMDWLKKPLNFPGSYLSEE